MHRASGRFWSLFPNLPKSVQKVARKNFELLKENPSHPSLHFKKLGKLWPIRVGRSHRALAVEDGADYLCVWIGSHDEYNRLIKMQG